VGGLRAARHTGWAACQRPGGCPRRHTGGPICQARRAAPSAWAQHKAITRRLAPHGWFEFPIRSSNPGIFIASLCVFNFAWLAFSTVQFGVIAKADSIGTATVAMSAAWYAGFTIGPYLAGDLVVRFGFTAVQYLGIGGVLIALLSLLPLSMVRPRR
jgi:hypothetical protein